MTEKKSYQSWTTSDELWNVIKDEIPQKKGGTYMYTDAGVAEIMASGPLEMKK